MTAAPCRPAAPCARPATDRPGRWRSRWPHSAQSSCCPPVRGGPCRPELTEGRAVEGEAGRRGLEFHDLLDVSRAVHDRVEGGPAPSSCWLWVDHRGYA